MTVDEISPAAQDLFAVDGRMKFSAGRIAVDSPDLEYRLLIPDETTIAGFQNRGLPGEKQLSFTFSKDIKSGTHTLGEAGSPFRAANFHERLNDILGPKSLEHYKAIEGKVVLTVLGNLPYQMDYLVNSFELTVESLTTGKTFGILGNFLSQMTYSSAK